MRLKRFLPFFLLLFIPAVIFSSFLFAAESQYDQNIRGIEQQEIQALDPFRAVLAGLLYLPRKIADGALYASGRNAQFLSDPDFIRKVKDILYLYEKKLLWFPIVGYTSGFRPTYGAGLYYKDAGLRSLLRASMYDAHYWSLSWKNDYLRDVEWGTWKSSILGVLETKNDRRFYGIGADPRNDSRNAFIASNDYGTYTQDRRKLQWSTGFESRGGTFETKYLGFVQRRAYKSHGHGRNDLEDIFDVSRIPGFQHPTSQIYNELSVTMDTRKNQKMLSPGFRGEIYGGFSNGLGDNKSDLFRTGFDVAGFLPVIKQNRLLVPRLVFDAVENLDNTPIPFAEYPRHHTFRGLSTREVIRSERVSLVPSIEYQWPISHILSGHIFFDTLIVGPRVTAFRWHESLWATGVGLDFHYLSHEIGRIELAGGSEGIYLTLTFGTPLRSNHRADW